QRGRHGCCRAAGRSYPRHAVGLGSFITIRLGYPARDMARSQYRGSIRIQHPQQRRSGAPRKWLTTYDTIGRQPGDRLIMSWDIALSETETGDYSACVVLLMRQEVFYILEVVRGRFPFGMLKRKVMEVKERYNPATLLIEDSPISRGLIQSLREQSINVTTHKPETDKRARVIAQTDLFQG